jgi:UDP-3-O-[3-hydroxymyristoyl] glucosamine N-acyltransferase
MLTTGEIAKQTGGKLVGSPDVQIQVMVELEKAGEKAIACAFDKEHLMKVKNSPAAAFLVTAEVADIDKPQVIVKNGRLAMAQVLTALYPQNSSEKDDVHPTAVVHSSVRKGMNVTIGPYAVLEEGVMLGDNVNIGAHCYIGQRTTIGARSIIFPHVSIFADTVIGERVRINSCCSIGVDGFGFVEHEGRYVKIPQVGRVVLEDDVDLCGLNTIARATIGETRVGAGTKVDSLVHIAHNVKIGRNCIIVAQAGMAGNVVLGDHVTLAGRAAISDHITVGDNSVILACSVVTKDCPPGSVLLGFPARDHRAEKKKQALVEKLGELFDRLKKLENQKPDKSKK